jgi:hypothetical protein
MGLRGEPGCGRVACCVPVVTRNSESDKEENEAHEPGCASATLAGVMSLSGEMWTKAREEAGREVTDELDLARESSDSDDAVSCVMVSGCTAPALGCWMR